MAEIPLILLPHTVTVETWSGSSGYDESFAAPVPVRCFRDSQTQMTGDGQIVDPVRIICRLKHSAALGPRSKVSWMEAGEKRQAVVQSKAERTDGGLGAWQHVEVTVQ